MPQTTENKIFPVGYEAQLQSNDFDQQMVFLSAFLHRYTKKNGSFSVNDLGDFFVKEFPDAKELTTEQLANFFNKIIEFFSKVLATEKKSERIRASREAINNLISYYQVWLSIVEKYNAVEMVVIIEDFLSYMDVLFRLFTEKIFENNLRFYSRNPSYENQSVLMVSAVKILTGADLYKASTGNYEKLFLELSENRQDIIQTIEGNGIALPFVDKNPEAELFSNLEAVGVIILSRLGRLETIIKDGAVEILEALTEVFSQIFESFPERPEVSLVDSPKRNLYMKGPSFPNLLERYRENKFFEEENIKNWYHLYNWSRNLYKFLLETEFRKSLNEESELLEDSSEANLFTFLKELLNISYLAAYLGMVQDFSFGSLRDALRVVDSSLSLKELTGQDIQLTKFSAHLKDVAELVFAEQLVIREDRFKEKEYVNRTSVLHLLKKITESEEKNEKLS